MSDQTAGQSADQSRHQTAARDDEHVVFFTTALGDPAAERYATLRAAVGRVESLRNDDGVTDAKVYQLVLVPLHVRPYFRVEVAGDAQPLVDVPAQQSPVDALAQQSLVDAMAQQPLPPPAPPAYVESYEPGPAQAPAPGQAAGTEPEPAEQPAAVSPPLPRQDDDGQPAAANGGNSLGFFVR